LSTESEHHVQDFRNLVVWQKAHQNTLKVYRLTEAFPPSELYGLTSQMRRSSASVSTNLAEGCGRGSDADLARFAQMAMGSASELEYQILLARDLGFMTDETHGQITKDVQEVKRMLTGLIRKLRGNGSSTD
jgi:four helix bundle protein